MRALLAAIRCHKGDLGQNLAAHLGLLTEAKAEGCELALFPEMSWGLGPGRRPPPRAPPGPVDRLAGQAGGPVDEDFPGLPALVGPDGEATARLPDRRPGVLLADIPCAG